MRPLSLLCLLGGAMLACETPSGWQPPPPPTPSPVLSIEDAQPPALVLEEAAAPLVSAVRNGADERVLILGLWADGRLMWSEDPLFGGPPYREARIDPERLPGLLRSFGRLFARWDSDLLEYHPAGASHVELVCRVGGEDRRLASWHESFERTGEMVVTPAGVERLEGRDRADVLAATSEEYRRFRVLWNDVRALMVGLVPDETAGAPVEDDSTAALLPAPR